MITYKMIKYLTRTSIHAATYELLFVQVDTTNEHESYEIAIDSYEKNDGLLVLRTRKPLKPKCEYILDIEYLGDLNPLSYGLFKITSDLGTGTRETRFVRFSRAHNFIY